MTTFDETVSSVHRVTLMGLGSGGVRMLSALYKSHEVYDIVLVDTDADVLAAAVAPRQFLLGRVTLEGRGAGGDMKKGLASVRQDEEVLKDQLSGTDVLILVCCLGGGTGTGAVEAIARLGVEAGQKVLAYVTLPFFMEGKEQCLRAEQAFRDLSVVADAVLCLPNQRIMDWAEDSLSMAGALDQVNENMMANLHVLLSMLMHRGVLQVSFQDVIEFFSGVQGAGIMAYGEAAGPDRVTLAVERLRENPVLSRFDVVRRSQAVLMGVLGGNGLALSEVQQVSDMLSQDIRNDAFFRLAVHEQASMGDRLGVALVAAEVWDKPEDGAEDTSSAKVGSKESAAPSSKKKCEKSARSKQTTLGFDSDAQKGRFSQVRATLYDGEDLDIPTYIRRGLTIPS